VDSQQRFALPDPSLSGAGAMRVWLLTADRPLADRRHVLVDSLHAYAVAHSGDLALVRVDTDRYLVMGPEGLAFEQRTRMVDHLVGILGTPGVRATRTTNLFDALAISLTAGRSRGALAFANDEARGRTQFEHVLLQVAARHGSPGRFENALVASARAAADPDPAMHPAVRALLDREHADMLAELFAESGDIELVRAASPIYARAARDFDRVGLQHQRRVCVGLADASGGAARRQWLPGFPQVRTTPPSLGYAVQRLCGFGVAIAAPGAWWTPAKSAGPLVIYCEVRLGDAEIVGLLGNSASPHRRVVAEVLPSDDAVLIQVGLNDDFRASYRAQPASDAHADVSAISIDCDTLRFERPYLHMRPSGPVCFRARPTPGVSHHDVTVHVAMAEGDDLALAFRWGASQRTALTFR
jgi:hypothetical protein